MQVIDRGGWEGTQLGDDATKEAVSGLDERRDAHQIWIFIGTHNSGNGGGLDARPAQSLSGGRNTIRI